MNSTIDRNRFNEKGQELYDNYAQRRLYLFCYGVGKGR